MRRTWWLSIVTAGSAGLLGACGGGAGSRPGGAVIALDDFVMTRAGAVDEGDGSTGVTAPGVDATPVEPTTDPSPTSSGTGGTGGTTIASPSPAPPVTPRPVAPGDLVVVDSLVGQINGRPIYADAFFAPLDDRLRAEKRRLTPGQFANALDEVVRLRLKGIVENELILAQAQSRLTEQQQQGLFAFLRQQQEQLVQGRGGAVETARRSIQEEQGRTMEQAIAERRDLALIQMIYQQEIAPRVIVSWKDVEREYERRFSEFNTPASAVIGIIRLDPRSDAARIEQVKERLERGEKFMEVAQSIGMIGGGLYADKPIPLGPNGLADAAELNPPVFRERLASATPGTTVGPFDIAMTDGSPRTVWLHVVEITPATSRSLYDPEVQLALQNHVLQSRRAVEQERYFNELIAESIYVDLDAMRRRLISIGEVRYAR
ncbi:MAG: hypothetical protein KJZ68_00160 [Phycisphaerales bacterium]|nr:hypothetical protein [Phycisphaerales bacterium]